VLVQRKLELKTSFDRFAWRKREVKNAPWMLGLRYPPGRHQNKTV
jgi:hypothetical protein